MRRAGFVVLLFSLATLVTCSEPAYLSSSGEVDGHAHEEAAADLAEENEGEDRPRGGADGARAYNLPP